jgi:hypothetical protein
LRISISTATLVTFAFLPILLITRPASAQPNQTRPWTYHSEKSGQLLKISYDFPYLNSLNAGRMLRDYSAYYEASDGIVDLDFKFNNTTTKNAYATSVELKLNASTIVNEAIPYVDGGYEIISIGNIGWGLMNKVQVSYAVAEKNGCSDSPIIPKDLRVIQVPLSISDRGDRRLTERGFIEIKYGDVPADFQGFVCVVGYLDYTSNGNAKRAAFASTVQIGGPELRGPIQSFGDYDLFLEAGKRDYVKSLPISDLLCANSAGRFIVHLKSDRTSSFDFDVSVRFTDGTTIDLGRVLLDYFRPPQLPDSTGPVRPLRIVREGEPEPMRPPTRQCP